MAFDYEKNFMGAGDIVKRKKREIKLDFFEYRLMNFLNHLGKIEGKICDIGCGGGQFLEKIKTIFPQSKCYGCDISKKAIELAKNLSPKDIEYKLIGKEGELPFENNFFDLTVSFNVLEHVEDIEANLKEIFRILKRGGKCHICVPCEGEPFSMTWFYFKTGIGRNFTYKNWGHIQPTLTQKKMLEFLKSAGFEVIEITYSLHLPVDFLNLFLYFLPKELLNLIFGKKAYQFGDAAIFQNQFESKEKRGLFFLLRRFWLKVLNFNELFRSLDAYLFKKIPFTASTMHITCKKS